MPRNYKLKELILESLDEKELSKKDLLEHVIEKSDANISDKTFNESLMSLLKDEKICIIGYDFYVYRGVKRIQSIRPDGIIFSILKTDFFEVENLIKKLNGTEEEVKTASFKLKKIFRTKFRELQENGFFMDWSGSSDTLLNKIIYYIDSQHDKQKKILLTKFAWSLSDLEGENDFLEDILKYIKVKG